MNKTPNNSEFIDFAYSPIDNEFKQRIINPEKKKIVMKGIRYLKKNNEIEIYRKKNHINSI